MTLEAGRQESFDLLQKDIAEMDVNASLDNTQKAINSLNDWVETDIWEEIDIKEDFNKMCDTFRNWSETEKELAKLKLLVHLSKVGADIDYDKVTVTVKKDNLGKDNIVIKENQDRGNQKRTKIYTLTNKWGKRYYDWHIIMAILN